MKRKNNIFASPIPRPLTSQAVSGGVTQGPTAGTVIRAEKKNLIGMTFLGVGGVGQERLISADFKGEVSRIRPKANVVRVTLLVESNLNFMDAMRFGRKPPVVSTG
jgi:hypothetical protein